ncbi:MAG: hypothetical protein ACRCVT_01270 [Leadbetterella sp.]
MIKKTIFPFIVFTLFSLISFAQDTSADSLLAELSTAQAPEKLLPDRMLLSQRVFWGQNGLFRKVHIAPALTAENRQKELRVRRNMFKIHQAVGIATAAGMLVQGILGSRMYNFDFENKDYSKYEKMVNAHKAVATGINISYGTTALMAFMSPPKQIHRKGVSNMGVHRVLSYVHLSGMITTNVLANRIDDEKTKKAHKYVGMSTFVAYAAAIAIIKFEF